MDFDIPKEIKNYLTELDAFIEKENDCLFKNVDFCLSAICANTSTGGSVIIDTEIGGASVFSQLAPR